MSKQDKTKTALEVTTDVSIKMSLNEFCIRLSATAGAEQRVELLGGFEHSERTAGRLNDSSDNYLKRYNAFLNKPA